ncbi:MAG: tetratricopeptide repeat protein [Cellvibrionaceae bacterium]
MPKNNNYSFILLKKTRRYVKKNAPILLLPCLILLPIGVSAATLIEAQNEYSVGEYREASTEYTTLKQQVLDGLKKNSRAAKKNSSDEIIKAITADGVRFVLASVGASRSLAILGEYDQAEDICRDAIKTLKNNPYHVSSALVSTELAEVLFKVGRSDESLRILDDVVKKPNAPLRSLVKYAEILKYRGRYDEAEAYTLTAVSSFNTSNLATASSVGLINSEDDNNTAANLVVGDLNINETIKKRLLSEQASLIAKSHWLNNNVQTANQFFREATQIDPQNAEAHVMWGDLFAEKHNTAEASRSYQSVLQFNPRYLPAIVGLAISTKQRGPLERALYTNPSSSVAFNAYAELALQQNKFDEASSYLNAALPNNEESLDVISSLAAIAILKEDKEQFTRFEKTANTIRPNNGEFYSKVAERFSNDYRFTEAVEYARKAIEVQPNYWPAYTVLGSNLIRLGEEEEGKKILERAFEADPYDVLTSNMLKVFDTLDTYVTLNSPHFTVKMSANDAAILWPYMEPLLEEAWDTLVEKYGFTPEGPILIEVFEKREDFAVRSVGLPDIGPLVGICFGKVITLISPDTLTANWQEIVWHEFAHIITLQMTKNRMPRWLSEGISIYEEFQGRKEWGRRQDLDVARALNNGKIFPIERIDDAFMLARSNDDLSLAYLQSYLFVEYIVADYGFDGLKKLINGFSSHDSNAVIIDNVFNKKAKQFNREFRQWLEARVVGVDVYVHDDDSPDEGEGHGHGIRNNPSILLAEQYSTDSLKRYMLKRIEEQPRDFQAHLQLGITLFKAKDYEEAEKYLLKAKEILPMYTGYPSPPLVLSQIYQANNQQQKYLKELEYIVEYHQHDLEAALTLAKHYIENEDNKKTEYYLSRAIAVDPYRTEIHKLYAELAEKSGKTKESIREYEILARLDKTDPVSTQTDLAKAYLKGGEKEKAKKTSLMALEIAPTYLPAQKILLEAIKGVE